MAKKNNTIPLFEEPKHNAPPFEMSDDEVFDSEDRFQYSCLRWATDRYKELRQWGAFSYPAGGLRDKVQAMKMKSTGQKAGLPDLILSRTYILIKHA